MNDCLYSNSAATTLGRPMDSSLAMRLIWNKMLGVALKKGGSMWQENFNCLRIQEAQ